MSMKELSGYDPGLMEEEDALLEAEIERELLKIDPDDMEDEDIPAPDESIEDSEQVDVIPSMEQYISWIQKQSNALEKELQECDDILHESDIVSIRETKDPEEDYLIDIAKQEGIDVHTLKQKILQDIARQDEEDEVRYLQVDQEADNTVQIQLDSVEPITMPMAVPNDDTENDTYPDINSNNKQCVDLSVSIKPDGRGDVDQTKDSSAQPESLVTQPGQGVVAEVTEADLLEKQFWKQLKSLEEQHKQKQDVRQQERACVLEAESRQTAAIEDKRREKQEQMKQEQQQLIKQQQENEAKLEAESEELRRTMESSAKIYEKELADLMAQTQKEKEQFVAAQQEQEEQHRSRQQQAALCIQKHYRGYRTRKEYSDQINCCMASVKSRIEQERIQEIEQLRQATTDAKEKQEQMEKARQKREMEVKRIKEEQEKRTQEEERKKIEGEKIKREEDERKKEEEKLKKENDKGKKEEEKKRKIQEEEQEREAERMRREEEKKRKEEEVKRREEIELQRREAEKERKEAERLMKELEKNRKLEEERKLEQAIIKEVKRKELEDSQTVDETEMGSNNEGRLDEPVSDPVSSDVGKMISTTGVSNQGPAPTPPRSSDSRPRSARPSRQGVLLRKSRAFLSGLRPPQVWGEYLPETLESRRLGWIQDCTAWSKILGELRTRRLLVNKKAPRRPISGKNLAMLEKSVILEAARVSALQQVTTVELYDLPGCNLRTLGQCQQLKVLVMHNCHLLTTEGIQLCKALEYVDFQHNQLENLVCKELTHLLYVDISHNDLTSMHGLEACTKLKYLNMSHNRITRIGGLDHLQSLHTLNMSHNQLITCKGIESAATLQILDVSYNHLTTLDDLEKLALLQVLDAMGNTLTQVPRLCNHVLVHSLLLGENNITDLEGLCDSWLPMLHTLNLQQNGLTVFPDLTSLLSLAELDISNNQLLELEQVLPGLTSVRRLVCLMTEGNPVAEEQDFRSVIEDKLPWLQQLDNVTLTTGQSSLPQSRYEIMCHGQLQQQLQLIEAYKQALSFTQDTESRSAIHSQYYTRSYNLATEHRYSHEYGEISVNFSTKINLDFPATVPNHAIKSSSEPADVKSRFDAIVHAGNVQSKNITTGHTEHNLHQSGQKSCSTDDDVEFDSMLADVNAEVNVRSRPSPHQIQSMKKESQAETVDMKSKFDALLSGASKNTTSAQEASNPHLSDNRALPLVNGTADGPIREKTIVGAKAVGQILKQEGFNIYSSREHSAATKIQAQWRGHMLRKRLQYALNYARLQPEADDDLDMEFGEVDLKDFDFNEDDLEKDWLPPEVPQIPNSHPVIRHPMEDSIYSRPPHPPHDPRQVWRGMVSPPGEQSRNQFDAMGGKPPLPPLSRLSDRTAETQTEGAHTYRSKMTRREEKITEEWGFKDSRTAELMIQRAKKLKYNAVKKKRLGQLDPKQRLALLRKLQETNKVKSVIPIKKGTERQEYFQAREQTEKKEEREQYYDTKSHEMRTYEWVHTQVGQYEVTSSRIQNREAERVIQPTQQSVKRVPVHLYNSDSNLPRMDPTVLAGGRALLTIAGQPEELRSREPDQDYVDLFVSMTHGNMLPMDLQSVESAFISGEVDKPRRMSLTRPDSENDHLPPIKPSSAPSDRPEKMSWRRPEVNQSIGWGGGKKRNSLHH